MRRLSHSFSSGLPHRKRLYRPNEYEGRGSSHRLRQYSRTHVVGTFKRAASCAASRSSKCWGICADVSFVDMRLPGKEDVRLSLSSDRPETGSRLGYLGEAASLLFPDTDSCHGTALRCGRFLTYRASQPAGRSPGATALLTCFAGGIRRQFRPNTIGHYLR
jgi:hypothetical protein